MEYAGLLTYQTPTGQAFFWSGTLPYPQCTLGSTRVECPHKTTRKEAERLITELCKQYPQNIFCLKGKTCPSRLLSQPKIGLVVTPEGHGVGIVTTSGKIRSLPVIIPHPLPSITHGTGTVPIVQTVELSDRGQLSAQITTKKGVSVLPQKIPPSPPLIQVPVNTTPIRETTKRQNDALLAAINKGIQLKTAGIAQRCNIGFYWSQKLGRCIAITGDANIQAQIIMALRKKFATLPHSPASVSTVVDQ